jgi:hypothetical protein
VIRCGRWRHGKIYNRNNFVPADFRFSHYAWLRKDDIANDAARTNSGARFYRRRCDENVANDLSIANPGIGSNAGGSDFNIDKDIANADRSLGADAAIFTAPGLDRPEDDRSRGQSAAMNDIDRALKRAGPERR